ncbi:MAG: FGGY family carbohydrate kinase [Propionicimonas sp.]
MPAQIIVALDVGGSYLKATAFDLGGERFASHGEPVPVISPRPTWHERDAEALWRSAIACVRGTLEQLGLTGAEVCALGLTGHGNGAYLVDAAGLPTRNVVLATDTRAASLVHEWVTAGAEDELREHAWNGLWAGMTGPVLAWLARHEPDTLERTHSVLGAKDYLRARLTGVVAAEISQASACGLYDNAVLASGAERSDLEPGALALRLFGLERYRRLLPPTVASTRLFELSPAAAAETGLPVGLPVVAGLVDNSAAQHGSGVFDSSAVCVGAGTWSINQVLVPVTEMTNDRTLGRVKPYSAALALDRQGLLCEASATSASTFAWALERAATGTAAADRAAGQDPYSARLERESHRRRRPDDPLFLPFINGSREDATARGAWLGLSSSSSEDDLLGAVLEGICLEHRRHIERLEAGIGERLPVRLSGGPTKSPHWCQLFADILRRPVEVSPVAELGSLAVAALAAAATGRLNSVPDAVAALGQPWHTYRPAEAGEELVEQRWRLYRDWAARFERHPWGPAGAAD